ncbi:MAG: LysR family transcriptional regulator [Alphaproteobacteria bacterium]|nr:LysR family transcriptional regulator [Alphaproteobacteria bacterium]
MGTLQGGIQHQNLDYYLDEFAFRSISAAGRALRMSYRHAWLLLDDLNHTFREPVAIARRGGRTGGGVGLTPFGKRLIQRYRKMETDAHTAVAPYLSMIGKLDTRWRRTPARPRKPAQSSRPSRRR